MRVLECILCSFLILCAIAVCLSRNLLVAVIIQMAYSMIMSVIWIILQSPDLAITEAAVGAGITGLLFLITLRKINAMDDEKLEENEEDNSDE